MEMNREMNKKKKRSTTTTKKIQKQQTLDNDTMKKRVNGALRTEQHSSVTHSNCLTPKILHSKSGKTENEIKKLTKDCIKLMKKLTKLEK